MAFGDTAFHFAVQGLYGCTSIVLVSKCGVYMVLLIQFSDQQIRPRRRLISQQTHFWEDLFKGNSAAVTKQFNEYVIDYLSTKTSDPEWVSIPELPEGCFTDDGGLFLDALIFTGAPGSYPNNLVTTAKYGPGSSTGQDRITPIDDALESTTGFLSGSFPLWIYNPYPDKAGDTSSAHGKIITTFNPDIFGDGQTSAFQAWAGGIVIDGTAAASNAAINTPMIAQTWTPTTATRKRAAGSSWDAFMGMLNFTGIEAAFY